MFSERTAPSMAPANPMQPVIHLGADRARAGHPGQ